MSALYLKERAGTVSRLLKKLEWSSNVVCWQILVINP